MPSLARIEAAERAELLTVRHYRVVLDLPATGPEFGSDTTITFACSVPGASTFLDLTPAAIESIELNGVALDPAGLHDGRLPLTDLRSENVLRVRARMSYSSDGEGMHRHVDPTDGNSYLYAMSFLDAAPRWFACFDQPDLKATYDVEVHCPADWTVLGNAAASRIADGHWQLATSKPLSTYFVTMVAGPYHSIITEHDGIRLGLHVRAALARHLDAEAEDMLTITRASFDRYHELFGIRYPFGEYHQAFVPDFNAGAMENPGCVTLREQYVFSSAATRSERGVRAGTIAHEMAHMWFGDLVTMRWWDDLWLNESFAEYMAYRVCSEVREPSLAALAWTEFGMSRKDWGYIADQAPSSHPVAGNGSETAAAALADFDGISYAKGAAALKQLAQHLGDEVFFDGLRRHFAQHSYGNAGFADLIASWTAAGAQDLPGWAEQWLRTSGLDTLDASASQGRVTVRRISPDASRRPHTVRVAGFDPDGGRVLDESVRLVDELVSLPAADSIRLVVADSLDQTWAKVRFGPDGWHAVAEVLPRIEQDLTRVVIYNAIRDGVRDGGLAPALALDILLVAAGSEPIDLVTAHLLKFSTTQLAGVFAAPAERPARRQRIRAVAEELLARAAPGSDSQLVAGRGLIGACDEAELLQAWRAGDQLPPGLLLDPELRWSLVNRLASLGELTEPEIDQELAADASGSGVVHAARARSLRPDPAAKRAAWQLLTEPSKRPAYELYATAEGFFDPSQHELTAGYLPRFFDEMAATAEHRHGWALAQVILNAFPVAAASGQVLELAEAALARPGLSSTVQRSFSDGTDQLRRSVTSLQRYGGA
ncbi:MAG: aminopeptidase N [Actinomycetota bacterium]|nr:aminopeptidase N [Actinomycetota bacterium]